MISMKLSEFEKQPGAPYLFDRWLWTGTVPSSLGPFTVLFSMLGKGDTNPPDEEMLKRATELAAFIQTRGETVLDIVFGHYLFASEQPDWLERCKVPRGLPRDSMAGLLRENRSLVVSRHLNWSEPYRSSIFLIPPWDEEHALNLNYTNGEIATANDRKFNLEAGTLRWTRTRPPSGQPLT